MGQQVLSVGKIAKKRQRTMKENTAAVDRGDGNANLITYVNLHETVNGRDNGNGNESQCVDMDNRAGIQYENNASEQ